MERILCSIAALFTSGSMPYASTIGAEKTLDGMIIDNMCAIAQTSQTLPKFTHTKECALMPRRAENGYVIYTQGRLIKFDKKSNLKIRDFLQKDDSTLNVTIDVVINENSLILVAIKNSVAVAVAKERGASNAVHCEIPTA